MSTRAIVIELLPHVDSDEIAEMLADLQRAWQFHTAPYAADIDKLTRLAIEPSDQR